MKHDSGILSRTLLLSIPSVYSSIQMKVYLFLALLVAMFFLGTLDAEAANHYVRAGASGANNGVDWTNAYTTLPPSLVRGDTYYIGSGSYGSYTFDDAIAGATLITVKKATASDHGTDTGWVSSYGTGQATFSGKIEFTTSNWVFDGVTGGGAKNNWNQNFGFKITEINNSNAVIRVNYTGTANNITIRHVDMQGKGSVSTQGGGYSNDGIAIYRSASNITLSYAWLHGIGRCPVFITGAQSVIFEHLYVSSYYGSSSVHSEVMSSGQDTMGDVTWRYSLITDIKSTGGLMWDNSTNANARLYVYGNIFYKPSGATWEAANGVIGGWTGNNGEKFRNVSVYNNTFINIDQESLSSFPNVYSGNIAYNNLWYNSQSPNFSKWSTHDYNHFINSGGTHSEPQGTSATSGNPFVDDTNLNFKLMGATTAGITLTSPFNLDPLTLANPPGTTRGADGTWDRGAFEYPNGGGLVLNAPTSLRVVP